MTTHNHQAENAPLEEAIDVVSRDNRPATILIKLHSNEVLEVSYNIVRANWYTTIHTWTLPTIDVPFTKSSESTFWNECLLEEATRKVKAELRSLPILSFEISEETRDNVRSNVRRLHEEFALLPPNPNTGFAGGSEYFKIQQSFEEYIKH